MGAVPWTRPGHASLSLASFTKERGSVGDWATVMETLRGLAVAGQDEELFFYGDPLLDVAVTCAIETPADAEAAGAGGRGACGD